MSSKSMERKSVPTIGPARVLHEADPETPIEDLPELLDQADKWRCERCGTTRFTIPGECGECGSSDFKKVEPAEEAHHG